MKACKTFFIFLLFALTWAALFWVTGSRTPWQMFAETDAEAGTVISLGDLSGQNYDRMGFAGGEVRYIEKTGGWLVGTDRGEIFCLTEDGSERWMRSLGTGAIQSLAVDRKGGIAYVGEKSPDGNLYAIRIETGDILWTYAGKDIIGADLSIRSEPSPVHAAVDEEGNVYAVFYRFSAAPDGTRRYISRIMAFSGKGEELWRYPKEENMDAWVAWDTVSGAVGRLAFATSNYDHADELRYSDNLYVLDLRTGEKTGSAKISVDPYFTSATMRNGPNFSSDGKYLAGMTSDGRGFLWDADGRLLWERQVSGPAKAGGAVINAAGRDAYVTSRGVLFGVINTFNRENWQLPSPVLHPASNSLFLFTPEGEFLWKYRAGGEIEGVDTAGDVAALAVGRNVRTHDYKVHGAAAVSLKDGREISSYHTKGPVQAIAISKDARRMAGIEVPAVTPEGELIGAYRLHIWDISAKQN